MNPMKLKCAATLALAVSLAVPATSQGQDEYQFMITGQANLNLANESTDQAWAECVLCKTASCSMQASSSDRAAFQAVYDPNYQFDSDQRVRLNWDGDFELKAQVAGSDLASMVQSYACQLVLKRTTTDGTTSHAASPTADVHWARPADGSPFTGVLTGSIP